MKFSTFVAVATSAAVTLFSAGAEAQQPVSGFYPVRGPIVYDNRVVRRLPLQYMASDRPDIYNMFVLALVRIFPPHPGLDLGFGIGLGIGCRARSIEPY